MTGVQTCALPIYNKTKNKFKRLKGSDATALWKYNLLKEISARNNKGVPHHAALVQGSFGILSKFITSVNTLIHWSKVMFKLLSKRSGRVHFTAHAILLVPFRTTCNSKCQPYSMSDPAETNCPNIGSSIHSAKHWLNCDLSKLLTTYSNHTLTMINVRTIKVPINVIATIASNRLHLLKSE